MSTTAPTHPVHVLPRYTALLAWLFVAICGVGAVLAATVGPRDNQPYLAAGILIAGALLVAAGVLVSRRDSRWLAVALVTAGALTVGTIFFWTILGVVLSIALIVLFVVDARRKPATAVTPSV